MNGGILPRFITQRKNMKKQQEQVVQQTAKEEEHFDFDTFVCRTKEDIAIWNKHARKLHREARQKDKHAQPPVPIKVPTAEMHDTVRVKFQRFEQPENVLKCRVRNKDIDWTGQLMPGRIYDLPIPVVKFLNRLAVPIFAEVKVQDAAGEQTTVTETKQVGEKSRFSCQILDF